MECRIRWPFEIQRGLKGHRPPGPACDLRLKGVRGGHDGSYFSRRGDHGALISVTRHGGDEAIAVAVDYLDNTRLVHVIANTSPEPCDGACQATLLDVHVRPELLQQLIPGDGTVSVLNEIP